VRVCETTTKGLGVTFFRIIGQQLKKKETKKKEKEKRVEDVFQSYQLRDSLSGPRSSSSSSISSNSRCAESPNVGWFWFFTPCTTATTIIER